MDPIFEKNLLSTKEAGELSGYSSDYLARLTRSEKITGKRIGHSWFVDKESLAQFLDQQGDRKIDRARMLARAREAEYRKHHSLVHSVTNTLSKPRVVPFLNVGGATVRTHALALSTAVLVVSFGAFVAHAAPWTLFAPETAAIAQDAISGFKETFGAIPSHLASRINAVSNDVRMMSPTLRNSSVRMSARMASPLLAHPDLSSLRLVIQENNSARSTALTPTIVSPSSNTLVWKPMFEKIQNDALATYAFFTTPSIAANVSAQIYFAIGNEVYDTAVVSLANYQSLISSSGVNTLALAASARDAFATTPRFISQMNLAFGNSIIIATHAAIRTDVTAANGLAVAAPAAAHLALASIVTTGDALASATDGVPRLATAFFLNATAAPAAVAPALAQTIFGAEYAGASRFVAVTNAISNTYLGALTTTGRVAYENAQMSRGLALVMQSHVGNTTLALRSFSEVGLALRDLSEAWPAAIEDAYLGVIGKSALALDTVARIPKVAAVLAAAAPTLSASEQVALTTYTTIHGLFDVATETLATLFEPAPTIILPPVQIKHIAVSKASSSTTTATTNYKLLTTNSYPTYTTVVKGISQTDLDQSLTALRSDVLSTVAGMIQPISNQANTNASTIQYVNMIQDLSNLIVRNGDFRGGSLSNADSVSAVNGSFDSLTVNGVSITGTASSTSVLNGGTGLTIAPTYGQFLLGNADGGYTLIATSSLGINSGIWGKVTGTLSDQTDLQGALDAKFSLADWFATSSRITSASYPLSISANTISLAFSTSTANTWGGTQTFTTAPVLGSLTGLIAGNAGTLYQVASSSLFGFTPASNALTFSATYPLTGGGDLSGNRTFGLAFGTTTANTWGPLQTFNGGATLANNVTLTGVTGSVQCLHVDANGVISGMGSDCGTTSGGLTSVNADYPITGLGTTGSHLHLAFGTSTSNTWGGTQTFTTAPVLSSLATSAGTFLATDASGNIIATTSPLLLNTGDWAGTWQNHAPSYFQTALGFTAVPNTRNILTTYPVTGGGDLSADRTIALDFGTSTNNTWGGTQTFTSAPSIASFTGLVAAYNGATYQVASSSLFGFTPASNAISINTSFPFSGGGDLTTSRTLSWIGLATTSQPSSGNLFVSNGTNGMYGVATSSLSLSAPFSGSLTYIGTGGSLTWTGLATTSQPSSSNILVSNGAAGVYGVATSTLTASFPLSGSFAHIGSTGSLSWIGLATTSQPSSGNLFVSNGTNGMYGVGTSSPIATYPVQLSGLGSLVGPAVTFSLAFGTTTANTWSLAQTFTAAPSIASFTGLIAANNGVTYQVASSSLFGFTPISAAIQTLGDQYHTGLTGSAQTLATSSADANLGMTIISSGTTHTFTPYWIGTLADNRITNSGNWNTAYNNRINSASTPLSLSGNALSWTGLATTSQPSSSNILVSNGAAGVYGVATTSATLGLGLSGALTTIGGSQSLSISTTTLYSGAANALPYFSSANTLGSISAGTNGYILAMSGGTPTWVASSSIQNLTTSFPLAISGTSLSWAGLATTSQPSSGNLFVSNGTNGMYGVATTTLTGNNGITLSAGAGALVGGSSATIGLASIAANSILGTMGAGVPSALGIAYPFKIAGDANGITKLSLDFGTTTANTWGGTQTFTNAPSIASFTGLIAGNAGTLYQVASSSLFGFTPISNSLTKGYFVVGNDSNVAQATSSVFISSTGQFSVGSTSPFSNLSVQNAYGNTAPLFTVASSTASNGSTASTFLTVLANGNVGIGTTSPAGTFAIAGANGATTNAPVALFVQGGTGKSMTAGVGGAITLLAGVGGSQTGVGGAITINSGSGGMAQGNGTGGAGGAFSFTAGTGGGAFAGATNGGAGGSFTFTTGAGGAAGGAPSSGAGGSGGWFTFLASNGSAGVATNGNGGSGGSFTVTAGNGAAAAGSGTSGSGGNIILNPGSGPTSDLNGNIILANLRGNVGIGTTSPYALLSVNASSANYNPTIFAIASSTSAYATSTLMAVLANGNVGIGSTTPNWAFSVNGVGNGFAVDTTGTVQQGIWQGTAIADAYIATSGNWNTAYTNRITSATYPLSISSNIISLAFGTTTANTWSLAQTFTTAPVLSSLATSAGTFLAADASGNIIATTSPISSITADYPLQGNGTSGSHLTLAFGTTTANTWSGLQTMSGGINVPAGVLGYQMEGNMLLYASSTNADTILGFGAGGQSATTTINSLAGNTALGYQTLSSLTTGSYNTAVGAQAMKNAVLTGSYNNAMGYSSLYNATGANYNNAIGWDTMYNTSTGSYNNAMGYGAMGNGVTTGNGYNNAIGYYTLYKATSGNNNVGIGFKSLYDLTTGYDNIMIGDQANTFNNSGGAIKTGYNNIMLGYNAGIGTTTSSHDFLNIGNSFFGELVATSTSTSLPTTMAGIAFGIATSSFNNNTLSVQNAVAANNILALFSSTGAPEMKVSDTGAISLATWNGSTVDVGYGGTGQTSFTAGNLLYGSGTGALQSVATTTQSCNSPLSCNGMVVLQMAGTPNSGISLGTVGVNKGGTGIITVADGALLMGGVGGGTANIAPLATSTIGSILQLDNVTGRPSWVATSSLNMAFTDVKGTLGVSQGGTGLGSFTADSLLYSNHAGTGLAFAATSSLSIGGNAATATTLQNARLINGVSFNGSADITIASTTLLSNNNTWSGTNIFSSAPVLASLTGLIAGNSGNLYQVASSSLFGFTPITNALTKGYFVVGNDAGTAQATSSIFISSLGYVGIGTTTPQWPLQVSNATLPQFAIGDSSLSSNKWTFRNAGGYLYIATSSPSTFATSSMSALTINLNGNLGIGTTSPVANLGMQGSVGVNASQLYLAANGNVGVGTNSLTSSKFAVTLSAVSITDLFNDQTKIASLANVAIVSGQLQLTQAVCGTYSVTGLDGLSYGTVLAEDNKCWLDRNLGATKVASAYNDASSYGVLYQWGRSYDGHQATTSSLVGEVTLAALGDYLPASCTGSNSCTSVSTVSTPAYSNYFATSSSDWLPSKNDNLWGDASKTNNVCPSGWHVPTQGQWNTWTASTTIAGGGTLKACSSGCLAAAAASNLKLPAAGYRFLSNGSLFNQSSFGYYWSATPYSSNAFDLIFSASSVNPAGSSNRAGGFSVRCIQN